MNFISNYILNLLLLLLINTVCIGQKSIEQLDKCKLAERLYRFEEDSTKQGSPLSQALLDSAIRICPDYSMAYMEKSVAFNKTGDLYNGFLWLNKAVAMDPINHLGYRGWIKLRKLRDFKGAQKDFKKLQTLTNNPMVWGEHIYSLLGECKLGLNEPDSAIYYYDKYIKVTTTTLGEDYVDIYAFVLSGIAHYKSKRYTYALDNFDKAILHYSSCTEAIYYKALLLYNTGKNKEALILIEKAKDNFEKEKYRADKYNEVIYQLYYSDIIESLSLFSKRK